MSLFGMAGKVAGNIAGPWRLYAELAVAGVLLAAIGGQTFRLAIAESARDKAKLEQQTTLAAWNKQVAEGVRVAFAESEKNRAEETRRTAVQKEIVDETQRLAVRAHADAAAAAGSHERLLERATAVAAACGREGAPDPEAAARGAPAGGPGLLLADVLRRSDSRSGSLAVYADQARIAGLACERAYDSLEVTP